MKYEITLKEEKITKLIIDANSIEEAKDNAIETAEYRYNTLPPTKSIFTVTAIYQKTDPLNAENLTKFWEMVEKVDWTKDHDIKRVRKLFRKYPNKDQKDMIATKSALWKKLEEVIDAYLNTPNHKNLPFGGDDSFGDMVEYVIAKGKTYYDKALKNPGIISELEPVESFSYAINQWAE